MFLLFSFEKPYIMNTSLYFHSDLCLHVLSPHLGLVFSLFSLDCQRAEVNHFDESQLISIFFCVSCFWCQTWESLLNPWVYLPFYELYSLILFLDLWLTLSYFSVCETRYGLSLLVCITIFNFSISFVERSVHSLLRCFCSLVKI